MKGDSKERYGSVSKFFHWGMAFLIGWQLLKLFDRINNGEHWVGETLVPWHVSMGSLLLLLIVLRVVWTLKQKGHRPVHEPAAAFLINAGHFLLYVGMVLMPLTGILYILGKGYAWSPFGVTLISGNGESAWMSNLGNLHSPLAWTLLVLTLGHICMALIHHFIKKDNTLRRMI